MKLPIYAAGRKYGRTVLEKHSLNVNSGSLSKFVVVFLLVGQVVVGIFIVMEVFSHGCSEANLLREWESEIF